MKSLFCYFTMFFSLYISAQSDTVVNTNRKKIPLQAVLNIESGTTLFAGQDYIFNVTTSGEYDIRLTAKNAKIDLIENSKRTTGGLRYKVIPIDTGVLSITIWNIIDEKTSVSLHAYNYNVINYTPPPLQLSGFGTRQIIDDLKDSTLIRCAYPYESGIYDSYEIDSWTAIIGSNTFSGTGCILSEELINYIRQVDDQYMHLCVVLKKNKTGYLKSEAIYLLRKKWGTNR